MSNKKSVDTLKNFPSDLLERFITKRSPVHMHNYRKCIRGGKPYIRLIFIDTDMLPSVKNIPFDQPDLYKLTVGDTQQLDLHVLYPQDSLQSSDGEIRDIQVLTLDCKADATEKIITYKAFDLARRSSLNYTSLSIIEQRISLDAVIDQKQKAISTIPYILNDKSVQYTNTATRKEHQYESYNHSLAVIEPRCYNYPISKTRTRSRIVRYHRYSRASRISSSDTGTDFKS